MEKKIISATHGNTTVTSCVESIDVNGVIAGQTAAMFADSIINSITSPNTKIQTSLSIFFMHVMMVINKISYLSASIDEAEKSGNAPTLMLEDKGMLNAVYKALSGELNIPIYAVFMVYLFANVVRSKEDIYKLVQGISPELGLTRETLDDLLNTFNQT